MQKKNNADLCQLFYFVELFEVNKKDNYSPHQI